MIVTFCGHSDFIETIEYEKQVLEILENEIGYDKAEIFLGEYGAFDAFAYKCSAKFKVNHPNVSLIFVTPYLSNISNDKTIRFDEIIYPDLEGVPKKFAITYRNKYMTEKADIVIAYINRAYGGAYESYKVAIRNKKKIYNLSEK